MLLKNVIKIFPNLELAEIKTLRESRCPFKSLKEQKKLVLNKALFN